MKAIIDTDKIRMVWVDLDDTIIDFRGNSRRALSRVYHDYHAIGRLFDDSEAWISAYERHNHRLWTLYNRAEISCTYLREERFIRPLAEAGMTRREASALTHDLDRIYLDRLAEESTLVDGALALLERLRKVRLNVGVLSNGFADVQHRKIASAGIAHLIDITVLSDDIGINKPDTRIFSHAMKRSGISDPSAHLMIGDNPATDIEGALAAGWQAILFNPTGLLHAPSPAHTVERLDDIVL